MSFTLKDPTLLRQQCYVDGGWIDADAGGTVAVTNPATGEVIGTVPNLGVAETRRAIGSEKLLIGNILRARLPNAGLDELSLFDGSYIEGFQPPNDESYADYLEKGIAAVQQA